MYSEVSQKIRWIINRGREVCDKGDIVKCYGRTQWQVDG